MSSSLCALLGSACVWACAAPPATPPQSTPVYADPLSPSAPPIPVTKSSLAPGQTPSQAAEADGSAPREEPLPEADPTDAVPTDEQTSAESPQTE